MHKGFDKPSHDNRLQVWGDVPEPAERLLAELADYGWRSQPCGWPRTERGDEVEPARVHLMVLDDASGNQLTRLQSLLNRSGAEWVVVCSEQMLEREAVRTMLASCAYACHCLPGDTYELDTILRCARSMATLRAASTAIRAADDTSDDRGGEDEMVGTGAAMLGLFKTIRKVAAVDAPVLIRGESGTGKELAARAVHERSARADGPFVAVNCAALPTELVQSELFGYEKGAFTGATQQHTGHVEAAAGGTLLLDEIGDLPLSLQVHLLRFLQSGKIQRIGGNTEIPVDVRVLAATHVPLEQAVDDGRFREDLYHRLNVVSLRIPPLRERAEDIEVLARFFFERFAAERPAHVRGISNDALLHMCRHAWPGNVRELINRMRRAMVMCDGRLISAADLDLDNARPAHEPVTLQAARTRAEREQIQAALTHNRHRITAAARELGVSRVTLYRLIDKLQLDQPSRAARPG